jgi:predicted dehydrogenase
MSDDKSPDRELRVAVVGVGAFGKHHARVYSELPGCRLVAVVDRDPAVAAEVAGRLHCEALTDPAALPADLDAVSVAVPTIHHAVVAVPLLQRGVSCLVEKPFAVSLEEGQAMVDAARGAGAVLATGHIERFNPTVMAVGPALAGAPSAPAPLRPRFIECHRIAPFSFRSADIGVVLDLMIHDLDLVLHLAASEPVRVDAVGVPVLTPHEDIANARIEFANGCVADVTASRVGTRVERKLRLFSKDAYVVLDFARKEGWTYRKSPELTLEKVMALRKDAASLADLKGAVFGDLLKVEPMVIEEQEPLRAELGSFLDAVRTGGRPVVSGEDGLRALRLAFQVLEAIKVLAAKG